MEERLELYKHIYKDCDMAVYTIHKLLDDIKEKDNKIKETVEEILKMYESFYEDVESTLIEEGVSLDVNGFMSKMGAKMGISKEVKNDNSDSSIADMLIKGVSMGVIDMEKKIKDYEKKVNKKDIKLAKDFLQFQQDSITGLKRFL